jgi:kumamolisin
MLLRRALRVLWKGEIIVNFRIVTALGAAISAVLAAANAQAGALMTRHMREEVRIGAAQPMARMEARQVMNLNIVLPLGDPAGLDSFLADVYNAASPNFHHFLTVAEFTQKFGPTQEDYDSVVAFAKANGLEVTGGSRDGMQVQVSGSVAAVEKAFHVRMLSYPRASGNGTFYGPGMYQAWITMPIRTRWFTAAPNGPPRTE